MRWARAAGIAWAFTVVMSGVAARVEAQVGAVRLSGEIETFWGVDIARFGEQRQETMSLGSRYAPTLDGFVWDPRFLTFSLSGTYASDDTSIPGGDISIVQTEPYRLHLHFFSQAPHSVEIRAARTDTETAFAGPLGEVPSRTVTEEQELTWRYRGNADLPETSLQLRRQHTQSETLDSLADETRTSLVLRVRKTLARSLPTFTYGVEMIERELEGQARAFEPDGVSHEVKYEDQIRVGQRALLTPLARVEIGEDRREAEAGLTLAGPLSTTLDGSTSFRYNFQDVFGETFQSLSANGTLTKRFSDRLSLAGGLTAVALPGDDFTWAAGGFLGVSAMPVPHLQTVGDYGLQLNHDDEALGVNHRVHAGAVSTYVPRHRFFADYYLNVADLGGDRDVFTSHAATVGATSLVIPLTTVDAWVGGDRHDGNGRQVGYRSAVSAVVTPSHWLSLRGRVDYDSLHRTDTDRPPVEETRYGVEVGVDTSPLSWLTLFASGRMGWADIDREDKRGLFQANSGRAGGSLRFGALSVTGEAFLEEEPITSQERRGVRGAIAYQYRAWTFRLDGEEATVTTDGIEQGRTRVLFRITRQLDYRWP